VDLGQLHDPTTIAVVEQISAQVHENIVGQLTRQGSFGLERLEALETAKPRTQYNIRLLEQAPLGEPYPAQATRLKRILARQAIAEHDPPVWIDYTGVGRAVFDIFRELNVPHVVPVTITFAGEAGPNGRGGHSVPKIELVSKLQALMHSGVLHMPDTLPLVKVFRRELLDFRVSYTAIGNATFGAREGAHDDTILAVALAVYGLEGRNRVAVGPLLLG